MKYVIPEIYVSINDYCLGYSKKTLGLQVIFSYTFLHKGFLEVVCVQQVTQLITKFWLICNAKVCR